MKQAKFCVGLNCRPNNIETILDKRSKDIYEVFAAAPPNIAPTGRRGNIPIDLNEIKRQIKLAHDYGVRYDLIMNGTCFGGKEFSKEIQEKIGAFIRAIDAAEVDSITVANPFLLDLIRRHSKSIEIVISSYAEVIEPHKIERFQKMGANRIILHREIYRNFEMIKKIKENSKLPLEIIPNTGCLHQCIWFICHTTTVSHTSTASDEEIKKFGNYNQQIQWCRAARQIDPLEFLMSNFIRPENLSIYEKMGFNLFKLAGRRASTSWMLNVIDAYKSRSYDGNVFELSTQVGDNNPVICNLPNKELDGWYEHMGSNSDYHVFRKKAEEFCKKRNLERFYSQRKAES